MTEYSLQGLQQRWGRRSPLAQAEQLHELCRGSVTRNCPLFPTERFRRQLVTLLSCHALKNNETGSPSEKSSALTESTRVRRDIFPVIPLGQDEKPWQAPSPPQEKEKNPQKTKRTFWLYNRKNINSQIFSAKNQIVHYSAALILQGNLFHRPLYFACHHASYPFWGWQKQSDHSYALSSTKGQTFQKSVINLCMSAFLFYLLWYSPPEGTLKCFAVATVKFLQ